ncbi:unnamed protein product, partial [Polarella glacialis]
SCSGSGGALYTADGSGANRLGGSQVAVGSPCLVTLGSVLGKHHKLRIGPLTQGLDGNRRYVATFRVDNGDFSAHAELESSNADHLALKWSVYTVLSDGEVVDTSRPMSTYKVRRDFGQFIFTSPAVTYPSGVFYPVMVNFTLKIAARVGAVVLYPPPLVGVACASTGEEILPVGVACAAEGNPSTWRSMRLVLRSNFFPWAAARPYSFTAYVMDAGKELPAYRRTWTAELIAGMPVSSFAVPPAPLAASAAGGAALNASAAAGQAKPFSSLTGFVVGSRAIPQWAWRGYLSGLRVSSENPAVSRRSQTTMEFVTATALAARDELWIRPPPEILIHPFSCFALFGEPGTGQVPSEYAKALPILCELPPLTNRICSPNAFETAPCVDAEPGISSDSPGFAHRQGLRIELVAVASRTLVRVFFDTTPFSIDGPPGVWMVSTWHGTRELDVARVTNFVVWQWMDVTLFRPSSQLPAVDIDLEVEWWTLTALPAGGSIVVLSPNYRLVVLLFDLAASAERFDPGNLPRDSNEAPPAIVEALTNRLQITLCCELESRTLYRFSFGVRHPSFHQLPPPSRPELNGWVLQTMLPGGQEVWHNQLLKGYRLSRAFEQTGVVLDQELLVGGVNEAGAKDTLKVSINFMLPFAKALHEQSKLRILAPRGWEFPDQCQITKVLLGPYTVIANCLASQNELTLLVTGSINPGLEGQVFGLQVAVKPPLSSALADVWYVEAHAVVGSSEDVGQVSAASVGLLSALELEPRLALPILGLNRPSLAGGYKPSDGGATAEILAEVKLTPRAPDSFRSTWRAPMELVAAVQLFVPASLPQGLGNVTLRVAVAASWGAQLRCAVAPEPFIVGNLPPGALCYDAASIQLNPSMKRMYKADRPSELVIAIDDLIPLRPAARYNFTIVALTPEQDLDELGKIDSRAWPRHTAWSLTIETWAGEFRTSLAAAPSVEGTAFAASPIRDLGLLTTNTRANELAEVSLLLTVESKLPLPSSIEVTPPVGFRLDTAPSPLHPALTPMQAGINPFRSVSWQQQAQLDAEEAARLVETGEELYGVPCPFFDISVADPEFLDVATRASEQPSPSLCDQPPTLDASLLAACQADTYRALPKGRVRCAVLFGKAVIRLYPQNLSSYKSAWERDEAPCTKAGCARAFQAQRAWLPAGQYRLTLRGFNPSVPAPVAEEETSTHSWHVTIAREVQALGGGPRSAVSPVAAASLPSYRINAGAEYSEKITPATGGQVLKGSQNWLQADSTVRVKPSALTPLTDLTQDGRIINFAATARR